VAVTVLNVHVVALAAGNSKMANTSHFMNTKGEYKMEIFMFYMGVFAVIFIPVMAIAAVIEKYYL
jgi:uncharacterized membrane protein YidH (DUF202 family)